MEFRTVANKAYIDLVPQSDDKTILKNPHKGWFFHYIDNGYKRRNYRNSVKEGDHLEWFPQMNVIYLRFDWADIEVSEGKYDWSYIDEIMEEWKGFGYTFGIRICTYESGGMEYAVPRWLIEMGIGGKVYDTGKEDYVGCFEPDYDDELYLEKLSNFMEECGKKFNSDPLIEFIEVGTFGTWGEGHTQFGREIKYGIDTLKRHVNIHIKNFPDKYILINDDMITHLRSIDREKGDEFLDYCISRGLGVRDDSVCVDYYCGRCGYDTLNTAFYYDCCAGNAPSSLELEHYKMIDEKNLKDCFPYLEALKRAKATYSGFHGDAYEWYRRYPWFTEYCANRLGYWYFIDGIELPECYSGAYTIATIFGHNGGFSKAYYKYDMKIIADNGENTYILNHECPDNRNWNGGEAFTEVIRLDFTSVPEGEYEIKLGLFENDVPIKLALKGDLLDENGYYRICRKTVKELM